MAKGRVFSGQRLFTPKVIRRYTNSSGVLRGQTQDSLSGSTEPMSVTGSFRFDPPGSALKSTQQLPIDFEKWENHTFFCSAEANVNVIFDKIINRFPFDGTKKEYDTWLDELTGWEKYILDRYPTYTGYLTFSGTMESGPSIEVIDKAGILFPSLSRTNSGVTVLNPQNKSIFVELDLALPATTNNNQFLFHHFSDSGVGYAAYVKSSATTTHAPVCFAVVSGSNFSEAEYVMEKGKFFNLSFSYNRNPNVRCLEIISGSKVVGRSGRFVFGNINTAGKSFLIGTGSQIVTNAGRPIFTPARTLSASLNKLRVFDKARTGNQLQRHNPRVMFADDDSLLLSMRFNEPTGSYTNNNVILDHSGNSLHSRISNYSEKVRSEKPYSSLTRYQGSVKHPVLFPSFPDVVTLNEGLLMSASQYDANNPNLITKLVPAHYFSMAAQSDFTVGGNENGTLLDGITNALNQPATTSAPGGARMGQPQIISSLLFMWAREFDELKQMLDHVSNLIHVDYEKNESVADQLLPFVANYYGFKLPNMYRNASTDQLFHGEDVVGDNPTGNLLAVQNEMWRRILINLRDIFSSKGTVHAIKSLFRSAGLDPNRMFRFIEYGGSPEFKLGSSRQKITEISTLTDFSGSMAAPRGLLQAQGFYGAKPNLVSTFLSSSRVEVGYPSISHGATMKDKNLRLLVDGSRKKPFFPHGISDNKNDGLLTSGSWTLEGRFKFPGSQVWRRPQSLFRLHTTGAGSRSGAAASQQPVILNVVADPQNYCVKLFARPGFGGSFAPPLIELELSGVNVFSGDKWYISAGRRRCDEVGNALSSSYFLNAARQENGTIREFYTTSSAAAEAEVASNNLFQTITNENTHGAFIVIGTQSLGIDPSIGYLNSHSQVSASLPRVVDFDGKVGHLRFFSKALTQKEVKEHVLNFKSFGVEDPLKNFSFSQSVTGSWNRLRLDITCDQPVTKSLADGTLKIVDFSQQSKILRSITPFIAGQNLVDGANGGSTFVTSSEYGAILRGFETNKGVIKPERYDFSAISSYYDENSQENKVRVASFTQGQNLFELGGLPAPIYELPRAHEPKDDSRFAIEFSVMQALNEDIMQIFATLESLDNVLGAPELMFAEEYPGLRDLRDVYFNRLTDTVNYKNFFDFFRWLDDSFDVMIENLIPRKTNYLGFNFILESHALERAKVAHGFGDVYLGESTRRNLKGIILLRQLIAEVRKI